MGAGIKMEVLTGTFWAKDGVLVCTPDEGGDPVPIVPLLDGFVGLSVKFALHHWPVTPQEGLPGWGSCFWGSSGDCPAGHAKNPSFMVNVGGEGILRRDGERWSLERDAASDDIPLGMMEGHRGRLAVVQVVTAEEFKKGFVMPDIPVGPDGSVDAEKVEALGEQLRGLRDMLGQFKSFLKEG